MAFGMPAVSDFCFLVEDVERCVLFYQEKFGFKLRSRAEGFADFTNGKVALALWQIDHIATRTGISSKRSGLGVHKACAAMEVTKPEDIDAIYTELLGKGVIFVSPPKDYEWRARCIYFTDPEENLWEIYAWLDSRRFGEVMP